MLFIGLIQIMSFMVMLNYFFFLFSAVHSKSIEIKPPFIMPSHYGGQLIFVMPGNNFIYTHLKDKKEIRHKKRWSQVCDNN